MRRLFEKSRLKRVWPSVRDGPDIKGLEDFSLKTDRGKPLWFAGRKAEIRHIEKLAGFAGEGEPGLTHVITAAPGAGKTALLRELESRWKRSGEARPVYLEATDFADPAGVIETFLARVDPKVARTFGSTREGGSRSGAKPGAAGIVEVGSERDKRQVRTFQRTHRPATFRKAFEAMEERDPPVVLLVDEAQGWEGDLPSGRSGLLAEAHTNANRLPLSIVAAGLGDAAEVVAARGASKLKTEQGPAMLGALSEAEVHEACAAFFDHFGVLGSETRRAEWAEALILGTDGWPRHLTNALRGAAEQLAKAGGDLEKASLEEALQSAGRFRQQYYADQIRPFKNMPELLSAVFAAMPEGGGSGAALRKAIVRAYDENPDFSDVMPRAEVFRNLLHKGLTHEIPSGDYDCPIPSLRSAVKALCAKEASPVTGNAQQAEASEPDHEGPEMV